MPNSVYMYQSLRRSCAAAAAAMVIAGGSVSHALADDKVTFRDFPFLIYCQYAGIDHAYYFSRLGADDTAVYMTPDRLAGMITVDGVAKRIGGEQSGTCGDRTIDELRLSGQAFDLR